MPCRSSRRWWVYPRVYGEASRHSSAHERTSGLSPRVRGSRNRPDPRSLPGRSIPACTGKPSKSRTNRSSVAVYPRVYGEASVSSRIPMVRRGLSPRVRGSLSIGSVCPMLTRSIPACTGKPTRPDRPRRSRQVYPRVYGEAAWPVTAENAALGLSPRVRGSLRLRP